MNILCKNANIVCKNMNASKNTGVCLVKTQTLNTEIQACCIKVLTYKKNIMLKNTSIFNKCMNVLGKCTNTLFKDI